MEQTVARASAPSPVVFRDGFGDRRRIADPGTNDKLEVLCLRSELAALAPFELALRERVARLTAFQHASFGRARTVCCLNDTRHTLAVGSDAVAGVRLSEILANAERRRLPIETNVALGMLRQIVPAMAALHEQGRDVAHGALGPERIVITPDARLVLVEHVMGSALEQLKFSHDRFWKELRVACRPSAGSPAIDHRTDVMQIGAVALSLVLGRLLRDNESPSTLSDLVASIWEAPATKELEAVPAAFRSWLARALQLNLRDAFLSVAEAQRELDAVMGFVKPAVTTAALDAFLARYQECVDKPAAVPPARMSVSPGPPASAVLPASPSVEPQSPLPLDEPTPPTLVERDGASVMVAVVRAAPEGEPSTAPVETTAPTTMPALLRLGSVAAPEAWTVQPEAQPEGPIAVPTPNATVFDTIATEPLASEPPLRVDHAAFDDVSTDPSVEPSESSSSDTSRKWRRGLVAAALLLACAGAGIPAARHYLSPAVTLPAEGMLSITSNPAGARLVVDGEMRGVTPLTLTVKAGTHVLDLKGAGEPRTLSVNVARGAQVSQYVELSPGKVMSGSLQVRTEPSSAQVIVDGTPRGTSPLTVSSLSPGEHVVLLEGASGTTKQTVTIEAGATASLVAQLTTAPAANLPGWITVSAPSDVQLYENGRLLGSSQTDRLMVPAGTHNLEIVNQTLGYRITRTVQVTSEKVSTVKLEFPIGTIALNATPWADVWIDGAKVGQTPIGNLPVTIGSHEIIFRHPDLGEQRHTATVTLTAPARLSVDMRQK